MLQISDPDNTVYYIEDITDLDCPVIDPMLPFSSEDEAVRYAIDVMELSVLNFIIMEWKVD